MKHAGFSLSFVVLALGCDKPSPPPTIDPATREALKQEILAELRAELSGGASGAIAAAPAGAAPEDEEAAAEAEVPPIGGAEAPGPIAAPEPGGPAVEMADEAEPEAPAPPPLRPAPAPVEEPFEDAPAGGPRAVAEDAPSAGGDDFVRKGRLGAGDEDESEAPAPRARDLPPAPAPFPEAASGKSPMKLAQFALAEDVDREERAPVRPGAKFKLSQGKVYAYTIVKNEGPDSQIGIEWEQAGEVKSRLYLKVGHSLSGWRTWSTLRMEPDAAGKWIVRIVDAQGRLLDEKPFTISAR